MYAQLPKELRIEVMKYLTQRDVAKLMLSYSSFSVPELDAFRALVALEYLEDCWDLVGNAQLVYEDSESSEESEILSKLEDLNCDAPEHVITYPSLNFSDESEDDLEVTDEYDSDAWTDGFTFSEYSSSHSEYSNSEFDFYSDSQFFPKFDVTKRFDEANLDFLYTISEFVSEINLFRYVPLDSSVISRRVQITAIVDTETDAISFFKYLIHRIDRIVLTDLSLVSVCKYCGEQYGWGKVQKWIVNARSDDMHEFYLGSPVVEELSLYDGSLCAENVIEMLRYTASSDTGEQGHLPLKKLSLRNNRMGDDDLMEIIHYVQEKGIPIEVLNLNFNAVMEMSTLALCKWFESSLCSLRKLCLESCDQVDFASLFTSLALNNNQMVDLHVDMTYFAEEDLDALCSYLHSKNNRLDRLVLDVIELDDRDWQQLSKAICSSNCHITSLAIPTCHFENSHVQLFQALPKTRIRNLALNSSSLQRVFWCLAHVLPSTDIVSLNLMDTGLSKVNLEELAQALLKCDRHLQLLDLSDNRDAHHGLSDFAKQIVQRKYSISILDLQFTDCPECLDDIIKAFEPLCTYPRKVGRVILGDIDKTYREL
jgi:hypothetical protein